MTSSRHRQWPARRQQRILLEFTSLKQNCPEGIYLSLIPGDSRTWSGVLFVRKGPYAPGIFRFQVTFPTQYPSFLPIVTFTSDIFHPLVTPLTTYPQSNVSSESEGRKITAAKEPLPPGGFSLKYAFADHFEQNASETGRISSQSGSRMGVSGPEHFRNTGSVTSLSQEVNLGAKKFGDKHAYGPQSSSPEWVSPSIADVLKYVKASFEDETLLDALPLEAAVSSGAWHAWAAYRRTQCVGTAPDLLKGVSASSFGKLDNNASKLSATEPTNDWNWDGVWVKRVRVNVETSISDPVLYGIDSDDPIHFLDLEEPLVHSIQKQICSQ